LKTKKKFERKFEIRWKFIRRCESSRWKKREEFGPLKEVNTLSEGKTMAKTTTMGNLCLWSFLLLQIRLSFI